MDTRREFLTKTAAVGIAGIVAAGTAPAYAREARVKRTGVSLEDAWKVHRKCLIIDGHNDTPVERIARKENPLKWIQLDKSYHTDIPRMKGNGQQYTAFMIVGNGLMANVWVTAERVLQDIKAYPKDMKLILTSKDAVSAGKSGQVGIILSIEGAAKWLDGKLEVQRILYRLGVRLIGITHGEGGTGPTMLQVTRSTVSLCTQQDRDEARKNAIGLSPFGREVLKANDELGIVTDLSHINDKAFYEVLELSPKPPIMSHTGAFAVCNHWRCLTDDQIRALAAKGGAMGVVLLPGYVDADPQKATIDRVMDHILHVTDLVGIDYVGFGSDFDGFSGVPVIPEVSQLVLLTQAMMERGFSEDEIKKFWGGNFLRVLRKSIDV
ncbi:MAG: dipeptidase [Candidatus Latescibacterota bacterium]